MVWILEVRGVTDGSFQKGVFYSRGDFWLVRFNNSGEFLYK